MRSWVKPWCVAELKVAETETNAVVGLDAYQDLDEATESKADKHETPDHTESQRSHDLANVPTIE